MRALIYNREFRNHRFSDLAASCDKVHSVVMASRIEPKILDAAIVLFADYGYFGVTTRELARKANVTEGSIYRLFTTKDDLFDRSLKAVTEHLLDPAQFLLMIFENRKKQDFYSAIAGPVRRWYTSLTHHSARLMTHASVCKNEKWRQAAYAPLQKTIDILADSIDREFTKPVPRKFKSRVVAQALILSLFQLKAIAPWPRSAKEENEQVEGILQHWLNGLKGMF